jgi:hypothetical protein
MTVAYSAADHPMSAGYGVEARIRSILDPGPIHHRSAERRDAGPSLTGFTQP